MSEDEDVGRVRMPEDDQVLGIVKRRHGGSRMKVACLDGKTRMCRIPGSLRRDLWVRESDIVIVEPWDLSSDEKGDIVYKYKQNEEDYLRDEGYIEELEESYQEF